MPSTCLSTLLDTIASSESHQGLGTARQGVDFTTQLSLEKLHNCLMIINHTTFYYCTNLSVTLLANDTGNRECDELLEECVEKMSEDIGS